MTKTNLSMKKFFIVLIMFLALFAFLVSLMLIQTSAVSNDDIIETIISNRSEWNSKTSEIDDFNYSYVLFLDLNFDGKPEFISGQNSALAQHRYKFYQVDSNKNIISNIGQLMLCSKLEEIRFNAYYDKSNQEKFYTVESMVNNPPETKYFTKKLMLKNRMEIEGIFEMNTYPKYVPNSESTYFAYDSTTQKYDKVSKAKYDELYSKYFSNLTQLNLNYSIVKIDSSDSYTNAYNKLKKSLNAFYIQTQGKELGDVNSDGKIGIDDVTYIQKHLANMVDFTKEQVSLADVDKNGTVSIDDVTLIQKHLAGMAVIE